MKKIVFLSTAAAALVLAAGLAYTEPDPYHTLLCKTSKKTAILVNNNFRSKGTGAIIISTFTAYFRKGTRPAGSSFENLRDGECSWADRGMEGGEIPALTFTLEGNPEYYLPKLVAVKSDGTFAGKLDFVMPVRQVVDFLKLNRTDGTRFTVKARRKGNAMDIGSREGFPEIAFK